MTEKDIDNFEKFNHKVHAHLFKKALEYHKSLPRFSWFGEVCQMDTIITLHYRMLGMVNLSKKKYGVYNKAYENPRCKMFRKCFPWF